MNFLKNLFSSVNGFFQKLFTPETAAGFIKLLELVSPYVNAAYPVVKKVAELTPTKLDDQIIAAYENFNMRDLFDPNKSKELALRDLVKEVLKRQLTQPAQDSMLNTAIELAYSKLKMESVEAPKQ